MKFAVRKSPPVEEDQLAAALWYEEQQPGLGDDFLNEAEAAISALANDARLYAVRFADVRCVRLRRFKRYGVFYLIHKQEVILLAIHHGSRDPRWLQERRRQLG